ncbi:unnamed protein product, partial [Discosporangium mesarthrocarpum]
HGCVRAVDGFFIRIHKPRVKEHPAPAWFYSGHKKGFGLNLRVTSKPISGARCIFTAGCISYPGSTNDRTAWNMSNVKSKVEVLPDGYYIISLPTLGPSSYAIPGNLSLPRRRCFQLLPLTSKDNSGAGLWHPGDDVC